MEYESSRHVRRVINNKKGFQMHTKHLKPFFIIYQLYFKVR